MLNKYFFLCFIFYAGNSFSSVCLEFGLSRKANPLAFVVGATDLIYVGEAIATTQMIIKEKGFEDSIVSVSSEFLIRNVLAGNDLEKVSIVGREEGGCGCNYIFEPGVEYLVFASNVGGMYKTLFCEYMIPTNESRFASMESELLKVLKGIK